MARTFKKKKKTRLGKNIKNRAGDASPKQLENKTKSEAEKPKLKFQTQNSKPQKMVL
jgi:hypothetical protein